MPDGALCEPGAVRDHGKRAPLCVRRHVTTKQQDRRRPEGPPSRASRRPAKRGKAVPKIFKSLFFQVVIALMLGIALGMANPDLALQMKPLGDGFIKLIKMLVPVIVFCVVVHGIAAAGDLSKVGRVGIRSLLYF
jgi:hypothetical protein